jgi:hypothetical protein
MGVHPACFFIDWASKLTTPERNRPENIQSILCISPIIAHHLASARKNFEEKFKSNLDRMIRSDFGHQTARAL